MSPLEPRPLAGKRVVVTRAADQAQSMVDDLGERGAEALLMPGIATAPLESTELAAALADIARYDWIVLTSTNAVRFLFDRLSPARLDPATATTSRPRLAVVGTATAAALRDVGFEPDAMPTEFVGTALVAAMGDLSGAWLLLPRSRRGREETAAALTAAGARVDDIALYDTVPTPPTDAMLAELRAGVDAVTFTSPSTVEGFLTDATRPCLTGAVIAAIGPVTTQALTEQGITVDVQPETYTTAALVEALAHYFREEAR